MKLTEVNFLIDTGRAEMINIKIPFSMFENGIQFSDLITILQQAIPILGQPIKKVYITEVFTES